MTAGSGDRELGSRNDVTVVMTLIVDEYDCTSGLWSAQGRASV